MKAALIVLCIAAVSSVPKKMITEVGIVAGVVKVTTVGLTYVAMVVVNEAVPLALPTY